MPKDTFSDGATHMVRLNYPILGRPIQVKDFAKPVCIALEKTLHSTGKYCHLSYFSTKTQCYKYSAKSPEQDDVRLYTNN